MAKITDLITEFLRRSRVKRERTEHIPPTGQEVEELISYLREKGVDPVVVGSLAVISHLDIASQSVVGPTKDLDLFISEQLPDPPPRWRRDARSIGLISWISPSDGYVDFLVAEHRFPDNSRNLKTIAKDPRSEMMGWPFADLLSLFLLKLNSPRPKDFTDLLLLAKKVGIPKDLERQRLDDQQRENLELIRLWIKHDP